MNQGNDVKIDEITLERQCDHEYLEELRNRIDPYEAVISLACGVGVQFMAEKYMHMLILPGRRHLFPGGHRGKGRLVRTLPGVWQLHAGQNRRYLSGFALCQKAFQRPLWRIHRWPLRN